MSEWTLSSLHQKRYGAWAGDPQGQKPEPSDCAARVYDKVSRRSYQCQRKRGYGPESAFCKQHSPDAEKERRDASVARYQKEMDRAQIGWAANAMFAALCKIADGDNDHAPRQQKPSRA